MAEQYFHSRLELIRSMGSASTVSQLLPTCSVGSASPLDPASTFCRSPRPMAALPHHLLLPLVMLALSLLDPPGVGAGVGAGAGTLHCPQVCGQTP